MLGTLQERKFSHAMYALRKIVDRVQRVQCIADKGKLNHCECARCVARDALEQIAEMDKELLVK